jgi:hypothetical protein
VKYVVKATTSAAAFILKMALRRLVGQNNYAVVLGFARVAAGVQFAAVGLIELPR